MTVEIHHLTPNDVRLLESLRTTFAEAFEDEQTYATKAPTTDYLRSLLESDTFIALAAVKDGRVVGGLTAYELKKFEQERSEIYIYDLAVLADSRREGIALTLISELKNIARERGASVMFVQADTGVEDKPAIALYSKLGKRQDVFHFDIRVEGSKTAS